MKENNLVSIKDLLFSIIFEDNILQLKEVISYCKEYDWEPPRLFEDMSLDHSVKNLSRFFFGQ